MFVCASTLLAFISFALAQGNLTGLLQALNSSGLDQLANAAASLNGTTIGQQVQAQLSQGDKTIFAPTDRALSAANINNATYLADIISYHIVSGNHINQTQTYPNVTIGRTLLNNPSLVRLEGNESQVLVWSKSNNGSLFVTNQGSNITVLNTTNYGNTAILAIDSVLIPPLNISSVLNNPAYNLSLVSASLQSTSIVNGPSIIDAINSAHGITLFVPNNAGVQAAQGSLAGIAKNVTALQAVLLNHVINGTSVYSPEMSSKKTYTSAAGQNFAFASNSSGLFVSSGGSNQVQIVQANVLTSNGVVHVVDGVMLDTNFNAAAASSAFASATSVAAHTATETTTVASSTATSGAIRKGKNWKAGALAGMAIGIGQLLALGSWSDR